MIIAVFVSIIQEEADGEDNTEVHRHFQQVWSWSLPDHRGKEDLPGRQKF